jgi:hypothetical protein
MADMDVGPEGTAEKEGWDYRGRRQSIRPADKRRPSGDADCRLVGGGQSRTGNGPFRKLDEAAEGSKEKGILTPAELRKLIALPVSDPFSRLAVLLAARCGMRRGEIRGLQYPLSLIDEMVAKAAENAASAREVTS